MKVPVIEDNDIFTGRKKKIILAVANAIIPRGGAFEAGALDYDFIPVLEKYTKSMNIAIRMGFPLFLYFVEISPLLSRGRFFTRLSEKKAIEFLTGYEHSRFFYKRGIALGLRAMIFLSVYDNDEASNNLGYTHLSSFNK